MQWYDHPDQRMIDDTLDERLAQMEEVQREVMAMAPFRISEQWQSDALRAWRHLDRDVRVLQPQSSVPY